MSVDSASRAQSEATAKKQTAKLTQVLINFFTKAAQVILDSRAHSESQSFNESSFGGSLDQQSQRINKWFNLHMSSSHGATKEDLKLWKSADVGSIPPMIIETYLDLRQLPANQTLVLLDEQKHPWTVASASGKKQEVVLERWLIEFDQKSGIATSDELPSIYKQAIILFRTLYGYSRMMPAYKLKKKNMNKIFLGNKILDGSQPISSKGRIGLSKAIINHPNAPHTTQKNFAPIKTSMGVMRISIAYRNNYDFCLHEHEEVLSAHFGKRDEDARKLMSLSPSSSLTSSKDGSPSFSKEQSISIESALHREPYKVGSREISPTPGPISTGIGGQQAIVQNIPSSLERKVSITSNKSISNASLAAFLRNPRSSTPSSNAVPIVGSNSNPYGTWIPKSVSSSTGHDDAVFSHPDSSNNTPRFSSSFGSRASRRFSNTSIRQQTPSSDYFAHGNSVDAALSGLYMDDDINDFVRMIDSKSDLKLGRSSTDDSIKTRPVMESADTNDTAALRRYQSLKGKHQQLGDSVNASVILQSRQSSRKSSLNSPPGSFDQSQLIVSSLQSKLRENSPRATSLEPNRPLITSRITSSSLTPSTNTSPPKTTTIVNIDTSNQEQQTSSLTRLPSVHSVRSNNGNSGSTSNAGNVLPTIKSKPTTVVTGLATSPSIYDYRSSFKIDDLSVNEEDSSSRRKPIKKDDCEDEDDLLFTMSDMNAK
ncbi:ATG13 [Candida theae]|uniref:Autophagy-related protein 13 n=1 Tax=Candida theae TaxID=1198502 RepID=A0AAD5BJ68_9ASCO|nr:ATG13 [Candida theae]KAI5967616.1 ATG13 [Candida theae]